MYEKLSLAPPRNRHTLRVEGGVTNVVFVGVAAWRGGPPHCFQNEGRHPLGRKSLSPGPLLWGPGGGLWAFKKVPQGQELQNFVKKSSKYGNIYVVGPLNRGLISYENLRFFVSNSAIFAVFFV